MIGTISVINNFSESFNKYGSINWKLFSMDTQISYFVIEMFNEVDGIISLNIKFFKTVVNRSMSIYVTVHI
ncbi:MAG: hypothetical protein Kow0019_12100 [Methanobacteriaceae archaeon]